MQGSTLESKPAVRRPGMIAWRGLAWVVGGVASIAAAGNGMVMAVVFAASLAAVAIMAFVLVVLSVATLKARRAMRGRPADPDIIEARHIGGHSWVAYGWDGRP